VTPAVFLDRDGTLIEEVNYLDSLDRFHLYPWTSQALQLLAQAAFKLVVITNQAGVARGYFDEPFVHTTHDHLRRLLEHDGVVLDGIYYCPHHLEGVVPEYTIACGCRKPKPGMLMQAARDLDIDLARSYVVGDRWSDVQLAPAVGAKGLLVLSGYGQHEAQNGAPDQTPAVIVTDLLEAARWIVEQRKNYEGTSR
jgi:D-glycero-D-manno-heptose 1,7-bisphosphate phosphatase